MDEVGQEWASVETSLGLAGGLTDGGAGYTEKKSGTGVSGGDGDVGYMASLSWLVGTGQGRDKTPERAAKSSFASGAITPNGARDNSTFTDVSSIVALFLPLSLSVYLSLYLSIYLYVPSLIDFRDITKRELI